MTDQLRITKAKKVEPDWLTKWLSIMEQHRKKMPFGPPTVYDWGEDWAVLAVPRGVGPRLIQEITMPPLVVVASPHYRAYLQNLVLIVPALHVLEKIQSIRLTMECLVEGGHRLNTVARNESRSIRLPLEEADTPVDTKNHRCNNTMVRVLQQLPSNTLGSLAWVQVWNEQQHTPMTPWHVQHKIQAAHQILSRQFRKHLAAIGSPVLGNAEDARSFHGHGLLMAAVALDVEWKNSKDYSGQCQPIHATMDPPTSTFQSILDKEHRFWLAKHRANLTMDKVPSSGNAVDENNNKQQSSLAVPMPLAYQNGKTSFGNLEFIVSPTVMIPRAGSYTLVQMAYRLWQQHCEKEHSSSIRVWDLGTGSGCLLLSLLPFLPNKTRGFGVDVSADALQIAAQNARALGLDQQATWIHGNFNNPYGASTSHTITSGNSDEENKNAVDIVLCNPPYHDPRPRRQGTLDASTRHYEPWTALYVSCPNFDHNEGTNGNNQDNNKGKQKNRIDLLVHYRQALQGIQRIHNDRGPGGQLIWVMEVFRDNAEAVYDLVHQAGWQGISMAKDERGCIRSIQGTIMSPLPSSSSCHHSSDES